MWKEKVNVYDETTVINKRSIIINYQIGWKWFKLGWGLGLGERRGSGSGFWMNIIRICSDFTFFVPW